MNTSNTKVWTTYSLSTAPLVTAYVPVPYTQEDVSGHLKSLVPL